MSVVHFEGVDDLGGSDHGGRRELGLTEPSNRSLISAPPAPPHQHHRDSIAVPKDNPRLSVDQVRPRGHLHQFTYTFGGISKRSALREIRQEHKKKIKQERGWTGYDSNSTWTLGTNSSTNRTFSIEEAPDDEDESCEGSPLMGRESNRSTLTNYSPSPTNVPDTEDKPWEALKEMFTENKINLLFAVLPLAYWSHAAKWSDGSIFILNFLAMVPLASMLGVFTEELAAHTNDVIGGLLNATFGNAVELVVAIQALLANDFRVVQASLIGSIFSNLLLVLGMCFFCGGIKHSEQEFIAQGAVASIALLAFNGLILMMPEFFGGEGEDGGRDEELTISRIGALLLVLMYAQLLFFQLKTHVHLFEGDDDMVALIPFHWALIGLVVITGMVTILSEWLVGSIDGFCEEFNLGRSFVGVIILPVVGNAVEHISAVSVAMKNKMDLALGIALGSSVQIGLFVLPMVVLVGWLTGRDISLKFPNVEVYLYLLSVIIVSLCLTNQRSNWLEGSLLVFTYVIIAVGIYFEKADDES
eukprot:CAMPEP_0201881470 /NCGR_PEP_ID=MMETSP0902-20130614/11771_1 /ASSEMBLY_ACC=CAM_ASM_000551 /TAXON_ID=420261 /ORGANISM="Thalassiosira antarctica, Strain CCMP982" /LENGTH=528 /DNA_ID=CAMNT_0048409689 /DNA_START=29 /DNA_END=1615 /DNA_ORIENTATION=+